MTRERGIRKYLEFHKRNSVIFKDIKKILKNVIVISFILYLPNARVLNFSLQNLKNQIMTTNLWVEQVRIKEKLTDYSHNFTNNLKMKKKNHCFINIISYIICILQISVSVSVYY